MVVLADMIHSGFPSARPLRLNAAGGFDVLTIEEDPGKGIASSGRACLALRSHGVGAAKGRLVTIIEGQYSAGSSGEFIDCLTGRPHSDGETAEAWVRGSGAAS
jgi:hypothetical protein